MNKNEWAKTPPMGWNSWDCYGAGVTEDILLKNAEYMAAKLKKYGYEYVVCDIQWYEPTARGTRYHDFAPLCVDEVSRVIPAVNRFPSSAGGVGFKAISDKVHALGLKFGIHIMRGIPRQAVRDKTPIIKAPLTAADIANVDSYCPWNSDMYGVNPDADGAYEYYLSEFKQFAEWGVDYVKVDDICVTERYPDNPYSAKGEIELIRRAIDECGREMVLSLSPGPAPIAEAEHLAENANLWRLTGDFWDDWGKLLKMFDYCERWYPHVKEGCWPDCDMLPIGRLRIMEGEVNCGELTYFTPAEQRTLMSLWCVFRSPLMIGCELTDDRQDVLSLLTNEGILRMHRSGRNARPLPSPKGVKLWLSDDEDGGKYAAVFNVGRFKRKIRLSLNRLKADDATTITELWSGQTVTVKNGKLTVSVPSHGAVVLHLNR